MEGQIHKWVSSEWVQGFENFWFLTCCWVLTILGIFFKLGKKWIYICPGYISHSGLIFLNEQVAYSEVGWWFFLHHIKELGPYRRANLLLAPAQPLQNPNHQTSSKDNNIQLVHWKSAALVSIWLSGTTFGDIPPDLSNEGGMTVYLNRHTGMDRMCRVLFAVTVLTFHPDTGDYQIAAESGTKDEV